MLRLGLHLILLGFLVRSVCGADSIPSPTPRALVTSPAVAPASTILQPAATRGVPSIWSGLILATNETAPASAPPELAPYAEAMKSLFGYNQFQLIAQKSDAMDDPYEHWLTPGDDFCLSVRTHPLPGQPYPLKMTLYQSRRRIADFDARLAPDSPLFIRGPQYARGQLIILLHSTPPPTPTATPR